MNPGARATAARNLLADESRRAGCAAGAVGQADGRGGAASDVIPASPAPVDAPSAKAAQTAPAPQNPVAQAVEQIPRENAGPQPEPDLQRQRSPSPHCLSTSHAAPVASSSTEIRLWRIWDKLPTVSPLAGHADVVVSGERIGMGRRPLGRRRGSVAEGPEEGGQRGRADRCERDRQRRRPAADHLGDLERGAAGDRDIEGQRREEVAAGVADAGIGNGDHIGALVAPERKGQAEDQTEAAAKLDARGAS